MKNTTKATSTQNVARVFSPVLRLFRLFATQRRRAISGVLCLALMLTMIPMMSFSVTAATNPSNWSALKTAVNNGGEIKLTKSITASDSDGMLNVREGYSVTIDLNGYTINRALKSEKTSGAVINNNGTLIVKDTSSNKNGKITGGYNYDYYGGGIANYGTFTLESGIICNNTSNGCGGGIYNAQNCKFTMNGGSIIDNTAEDYNGGGVENEGTMIMNGGTISGNKSLSYGGGIDVRGHSSLTMNGGKITNNSASYGGGGIFLEGSLKVKGSATVCDNYYDFGMYGVSVVADNLCVYDNPTYYRDNYFTVTAELTGEIGINALDNVSGILAKPGNNYTITNKDLEHMYYDSSRYEPKLENGNVVTGQYELNTWAELQRSINNGDNIRLTNDITAASSDEGLVVPKGKTVIINLNNKKIDRALTSQKSDGYVIKNLGTLTIRDANSSGKGLITGGNNANQGTTVSGGGICNYGGTLNIQSGAISGNKSAAYGGGVSNELSGIFSMSGGKISDNSSMYGGGVSNSWQCEFTLSDGEISGNSASSTAGALYSGGKFTMNNGQISMNSSGGGAGAIFLTDNSSKSYLLGGSITDNSCVGSFGGVEYYKGACYIGGSINITGNKQKATAENGVLSGGSISNLFIESAMPLLVTSKLSGTIGVLTFTSNPPIIVASGCNNPSYQIVRDDVASLVSDDSTYKTELDGNGDIVLRLAPKTLKASDFTFTAPDNLVYNAEEKNATVKAKDGINAGAVTVKYYDANGKKLDNAPKDAGNYTVKIDTAENDDYSAATDLTDDGWTFTIAQKELTVTPDSNQSVYYGEPDSALTYSYSGSVNTDEPGFTGALSRQDGALPGKYAISAGTLKIADNDTFKAGNYTMVFSDNVEFVILQYNPTELATLTPDGENGWFSSNEVILIAPDGFKLSTSDALENNTWTDTLTLDGADGRAKQTDYYLKNDTTGAISTKQTANYKIDTVAPVITGATDGDELFETQSLTLTVTEANAVVITVDGETLTHDSDGKFTISSKKTVQRVTATDEAGNDFSFDILVTASKLGDADGDGDVSIIDATIIQLYLTQLITAESINLNVSDVDNSSQVTIEDATCIQKYLASIIPDFSGND